MRDPIHKISFVYSIALHIGIIAISMVNLSIFPSEKNEEERYAIVMDVVDISTITNVKVQHEVEKEQKSKNQAKSDESEGDSLSSGVIENIVDNKNKVSDEELKDNQEINDSTKAKEEKVDKQIKDSNDRQLKKKEDVKEKEDEFINNMEKLIRKDIKKEESKKKEDKAPKKEKENKKSNKKKFANSTLKSLDEGGKRGNKKAKTQAKKKSNLNSIMNDALLGDTNSEYDPNAKMTISEIDAIKSKISRSWNANAFADNAAEAGSLKVQILVTLDRDGSIIDVKRVGGSNMGSLVESAIRAVYMAEPLPVPSRAYEEWREIKLSFDGNGLVY